MIGIRVMLDVQCEKWNPAALMLHPWKLWPSAATSRCLGRRSPHPGAPMIMTSLVILVLVNVRIFRHAKGCLTRDGAVEWPAWK